jgi:uncharacterized membrane protein
MKKKLMSVFATSLAFIGSVAAFDKGNWSGHAVCDGSKKMMYGSYGHMWGLSIFAWAYKIVILVILVLAAMWLWKQVKKKK